MKKIILLAFGGVLFSNQVNAQLQKGDVYTDLGASLSIKPNSLGSDVGTLHTGFNYMLNNRWSLGLSAINGFFWNSSAIINAPKYSHSLILAPQVNYYKPITERFLLSAYATNLFNIRPQATLGLNLNMGLQADYFISKKIALGLQFNVLNAQSGSKLTDTWVNFSSSNVPSLSFKWKIFDASKKQKE